MRHLFYGFVGLLVVFVLGVSLARPFGILDELLTPGHYETVDFQKLALDDTPNKYLICPEGFCQKTTPDSASPVFPIKAQELFDHLRNRVRHDDAVEIKVDPVQMKMDIITRSYWMRWPDWTTIQVLDFGPRQSRVAAYGRSVYGFKDFGANKERLEGWLLELKPGS